MQVWQYALSYLMVSLCAGAAHAAPLTFYTEDSPPYNFNSGHAVVGRVADKVSLLATRAKVDMRVKLLPWVNAYQNALTDPKACLFSTTRTPERESKFLWIGPLAQDSWTFYALASRNIVLHNMEEARAYRIGTYQADVRDTFLRARKFPVEAANDDHLNVARLLSGRIELWATGDVEAKVRIKAAGSNHDIVPVLTFNRVDLYLACNPGVPHELVHRMNLALEAMQADGSAAAIDRRYENWPDWH